MTVKELKAWIYEHEKEIKEAMKSMPGTAMKVTLTGSPQKPYGIDDLCHELTMKEMARRGMIHSDNSYYTNDYIGVYDQVRRELFL